MKRHPATIEYFDVGVTDIPADAAVVQVSVDAGRTWHPTSLAADRTKVTFLGVGPDATPPAIDHVLLDEGRNVIHLLLADSPEQIIRQAVDTIDIV